jgi:hypothetical protein
MGQNLRAHCHFFFLAPKSLLFLKVFNGALVFKLPAVFFFKKTALQFSFIFSSFFFFKNFLSNFFNLYSKFFAIFFFRLKLRGLGYRTKAFTKHLVRFFIGTTNYIFLHCPKDILLKNRRRRLLIASANLQNLRVAFINILLLKKQIPYRLRGIFFPKQIILLKPGKKTF